MRPVRHRKTRIVLATLLVLISVRSSAGPQDSYQLKYQLRKGAVLNYESSTRVEQRVEIMGMQQSTESDVSSTFQITSEGTDKTGNLTYVFLIKALGLKITHPLFDSTLTNPEEVIGARIRKEISASGDQVNTTYLDSIDLSPQFLQLLNNNPEDFPNLPTNVLHLGKSIRATDVDTAAVFGGSVINRITTDYMLEGLEIVNGMQCLKITYSGSATVEGSGTYQGIIEMTIQGDGFFEGTMYFAHREGLVVSNEKVTEMEITSKVTTPQKMDIPITMKVRSSLSLVE